MITAGSVRGNWVCPLSQVSSWADDRGRSGSPQRGQKRVTHSHSASPSAWKTSGAPASASSARNGSRPRSGAQSAVGLRDPGVDDHREPGAAVVLAEQHPQPVGGVLRSEPLEPAVDRLDPGAGDDQHPALRVGPPLLEPGVVGAVHSGPVVGVRDRRSCW